MVLSKYQDLFSEFLSLKKTFLTAHSQYLHLLLVLSLQVVSYWGYWLPVFTLLTACKLNGDMVNDLNIDFAHIDNGFKQPCLYTFLQK